MKILNPFYNSECLNVADYPKTVEYMSRFCDISAEYIEIPDDVEMLMIDALPFELYDHTLQDVLWNTDMDDETFVKFLQGYSISFGDLNDTFSDMEDYDDYDEEMDESVAYKFKHLKTFEKWSATLEVEESTLEKLKKLSEIGILDDEDDPRYEFIRNLDDLKDMIKIKDYLEASNLHPHFELVDNKDIGYSHDGQYIIIVFEYDGDKLFMMEEWKIYYYGTKRNQIEYEIPMVDWTYRPRELKDPHTEFNDWVVNQKMPDEDYMTE